MFSAFRQFAERTVSSSSSTGRSRIGSTWLVGHCADAVFLALQIDEHGQLVFQDAAGATNRFFRIDRAVGLDVDDQLVEVGALLDSSRFDVVGDPAAPG